MRPSAAFDLGQIRLAETSAHFLFESAGEVLLSHLAAEAAEGAFNETQVAEFFAELHLGLVRGTPGLSVSCLITIWNYYIAIRNARIAKLNTRILKSAGDSRFDKE